MTFRGYKKQFSGLHYIISENESYFSKKIEKKN